MQRLKCRISRWAVAGLLLPGLCAAWAFAEEDFSVSAAAAWDPAQAAHQISVTISVPKQHYLYAESVSISAEADIVLLPFAHPAPRSKFDQTFGKEVEVFDRTVTFTGRAAPPEPAELALLVDYQGCNDELCFLPQQVRIPLSLDRQGAAVDAGPVAPELVVPTEEGSAAPGAWQAAFNGFEVGGTAAGYLPAQKLLAFLDSAASSGEAPPGWLDEVLSQHGAFLVVLITLLMGLGLNLTPCVLPMIPVNLAIIGAGAQSGSRMRGFMLGGAYGGGIAAVYGVLGLIVVYSGSMFGQLNSSAWFNLGIAALFFVFALAMFDRLQIDFSRFQTASGAVNRKGFWAAALLGGISALLAGACVAPALISVLLLSADLHARGNPAGLLLPFVLGLGMAMPWPLAGAGLSVLPRPGKWMVRVKQGFGILILVMALFYAHLGIRLLRPPVSDPVPKEQNGWHTQLTPALEEATRQQKPVFIDFWATWCKACRKMDKTTFKDPQVVERLSDYVKVKFQAENLSHPPTKEVLTHFEVVGLPAYVVLNPAPVEP